MEIQSKKFKDYKVSKDPAVTKAIDNHINKEWYSEGSPEGTWDMTANEFQKYLETKDDFGWFDQVSVIELPKSTKISNKLNGVLDFLEKKENKPNPLKQFDTLNSLNKKDKILYVGKYGVGWFDEKNPNSLPLLTLPYPINIETLNANMGVNQTYIKDVKDGGIFVWNDQYANQFDDNYLW